MPELPEVETVRTKLEPHLIGRTFDEVEILDARLTQPLDPRAVAAQLRGERVERVDRRGKYLVVRFGSGRSLLIHLRMTGSVLHGAGADPASDPYVRAVVKLDDGSDVVYGDIRRFGTWVLVEQDGLAPYFASRLGAEPLGRRFTAASLARALERRRTTLKAVLLDQRSVAGLGNIYVDEALWRARLNPLRPAASVNEDEARRLHRAIRRALEAGIARQGATLRDYRTPDGGRGSMQDEFNVYGRAGEPCPRCGTPIEKTRVAGRGTYYCPRCQPLVS